EIGQGIAIVPRSTVELETARSSLKLLEFNEGPFMRPLAIIYKRGRELSPAVNKFIEVLTTSKIPLPGQVTRSHDKADRGERTEKVA
ncbi:MAG TPA: LysR family transcriptional regulator substrate-binding protein, partial [Candidatus Binataceae bacterium]|nr:LysR family transcriptional regulator substrate-binding protein [Candidatus Binataceae bacterium]